MRALRIALAAVGAGLALLAVYVAAHWALIETGNEVVVLRTQNEDGSWATARLWIVDDGGVSWLHGNIGSRWVDNLMARPEVEVTRGGETHRHRATAVPGPHPRVHELLRAKYGFADWWVRFVGADGDATRPVRLERLPDS